MLPDFRVRQRDYLLEITRAITQELDLQKVLKRILRISIEMLAGQAGLIALKEANSWQVAAAHGIPAAFLHYLEPLLADESIDHVLVTKPLGARCLEVGIDRNERKGKQPSDHAPVVADFA